MFPYFYPAHLAVPAATPRHSTPQAPPAVALDLQLVARANLLVTVETNNGEPVAGAEVSLNGSGFYGDFSLLTQTAADGSTALI